MATGEELQTFLRKRGFDVEVGKVDNTFTIGVRCKTTEEIASVLAQIEEPGRFIVSVQLTDLLELFGIPAIQQAIINLTQSTSNLILNFEKMEEEMGRHAVRINDTESSMKTELDKTNRTLNDFIKGFLNFLAEYHKAWWQKLAEKIKEWWSKVRPIKKTKTPKG